MTKPNETEHKVTSRADGYGNRDCSCGGVWKDGYEFCSTLKAACYCGAKDKAYCTFHNPHPQCTRASAKSGHSGVDEFFRQSIKDVAPLVAKERECEKIDSYTMNFRMGGSKPHPDSKLVDALREIEARHVEQNRLKGRDESRSKTLRIIREALRHQPLDEG